MRECYKLYLTSCNLQRTHSESFKTEMYTFIIPQIGGCSRDFRIEERKTPRPRAATERSGKVPVRGAEKNNNANLCKKTINNLKM